MNVMRVFGLSCWVVMSMLWMTSTSMAVEVKDVRLWTAPDHTRVVVDLSRQATYQVFTLQKPDRVVIDVDHGVINHKTDVLQSTDPVVASVRYGNPEKSKLRIVLDVKEKVKMRSFLLKPMQGKPHRIVIDLLRNQSEKKAPVLKAHDKKDLVIAVDAGHGGEDPGAIGPSGLQEKQVTLEVAKKLVSILNKQKGIHAVLTRKGDYFVPLKKRVQLVRRAKADLMISIHADSVRSHKVKGASVYTLSEKGATPSKVAAALAAKENAADAIGGVVPDDTVDDPTVRDILGDMAKRDSLNSAIILASNILSELKSVGELKYDEPKRARFVVLGALEVPSVLVEMDYISNPMQEHKLRNSQHQYQLASALSKASLQFLQRMGMIDSPLLANR